jgi:hypothetical protein
MIFGSEDTILEPYAVTVDPGEARRYEVRQLRSVSAKPMHPTIGEPCVLTGLPVVPNVTTSHD